MYTSMSFFKASPKISNNVQGVHNYIMNIWGNICLEFFASIMQNLRQIGG